MRWGKPRKNFKHRDPRYFLFEQQENSLENLFKEVGESFANKPFLHTKKIQEQEEVAGNIIRASEVIEAEDGSVSQQIKNYLVIYTRRKIVMRLSSFALKLAVGIKINALFGPGTVWLVSKIASRVDKSFNVHERIMDFLSADNLDTKLEELLKKFLPTLRDAFYPRKITLRQIVANIYNRFLSYATEAITKSLEGILGPVEEGMKNIFGDKKYEKIANEATRYFQKLTPEQKANLLLEDPDGKEMTELYKAINAVTGEMPAVNQPSSPESGRTPTLEIPSLQGNK
jgi:hypothetical protein